MREELDKKLVATFPLLYADRQTSMTETAMCWGFDCGDGWFDIIWKLSEKLEPLIAAMPSGPDDYRPRASQVKEKYGTLCFYMSSGTSEIFDLCQAAETASESVCETCGKPGILRGKSWYYTACEEHAREEHRLVTAVEKEPEAEKESDKGEKGVVK